MSDKLNQSLDDILKGRRQSDRRRPGARRSVGGKAAPASAAPVGGVKKNTRAAKAATATGPAGKPYGDSKILVSNLPHDVTEPQIKEYFAKSVGPVKKVLLTYGPNGQSRGVATVIFSKASAAAEAAATHNGLKVDNRPMRVEVIVGASDVSVPAPAKSLNERVQQPKAATKAQPRPATATKATVAKAGKKRRGKTAGRPKPKTADELDAEMQDYFETSASGAVADGDTAMTTNGGAVQAVANGGDTGMEDEVM